METESLQIKELEGSYPEMTTEFKKIQQSQYQLFCEKQLNYGPRNIAVNTNCETPEEIKMSHSGIWFRMSDKVSRLQQMIFFNKKDNVGESIEDSFNDLSVYGIIAQVVSKGKWGR